VANYEQVKGAKPTGEKECCGQGKEENKLGRNRSRSSLT